ncbi:MAG TPA: SAM-dependent methyltransferase, partial [Opitutaceae bacterium]|nr:SAM-dependent methyltransferase [Opitutaceae bacterium]
MILALGQAGFEDLLALELEGAAPLRDEPAPPSGEHSTFNIQHSTSKSEEDSMQKKQERVERGVPDALGTCSTEKTQESMERGPGWVLAAPLRGEHSTLNIQHSTSKSEADSMRNKQEQVERVDLNALDLAFPHAVLREPVEVRGESVNALAQQIADFFMKSLRDERVESAWPCVFACPAEIVGLGRRISGVEKAFHETLKKRLSRVARLAVAGTSRGVGPARGLFVFFSDFGRAFVAREAWLGGQRRMADDEAAPSRSFLKVEEAYGVLGREPQPDETVCDLGAAPGGWSYSAAQRGARVVAVDNGPLKGGALGHRQIEHRCEDAFKFKPLEGEVFDWLFCDLLEEPHQVLNHIVEPWLAGRWCRRF